MAQNSVQKYPTAQNFFDAVRNPLNTFNNNHFQLQNLSNFLNLVEATDYPDGDSGTLVELAQLRTIINTYLANADVIALVDKIKAFIRI